jgi:hypothetical protein
MKTLSIVLLAGLALLAGSTANAASRPAGRAGLLGVVPHRAAPAVTPMALGRTLAAAGKAQTCGVSCTDYEAAIDRYFTDVAHDSGTTSNIYSVATQYSDTTGPIAYTSTFAGSTVDTKAYPANGCNDTLSGAGDTHCLTDAQLAAEIKRVVAAEGWPTGTENLYFIFTPSNVGICFKPGNAASGDQCSTNSFCAYHNDTFANGSPVIYAVEPDDETIPTGGCDYGVQAPNGANVDPTLNTISHEHNEAITDPEGDAWFASDGGEDGDLCAWTFGTPLGGSTELGTAYNQVINGHDYWLQEEYSNLATALGGCVQQLGGTPSAPDPAVHDGTGPLLYEGGPVMRTNTVRAIYWMPPTPTNAEPPVVSGLAAVGKTLTTSNGTWEGSPSSYGYQWQSCSSSGTGCTNVAGATGASYKIASGYAGSEIRSEVRASNTSGPSGYVASTPTAVVIDIPHASAKPRISGRARVGRVLSSSQGRWTGSPSSFRYQWLRCSSKGTKCKRIAHATRPKYKLTRRDAKHKLRVRVTATNVAGFGRSTSGTTRLAAARH